MQAILGPAVRPRLFLNLWQSSCFSLFRAGQLATVPGWAVLSVLRRDPGRCVSPHQSPGVFSCPPSPVRPCHHHRASSQEQAGLSLWHSLWRISLNHLLWCFAAGLMFEQPHLPGFEGQASVSVCPSYRKASAQQTYKGDPREAVND